MSFMPLIKKCRKCKKEYSYNPSIGNLGIICPYCQSPNLDNYDFPKKRIEENIRGEKNGFNINNR